MMHDGLWRQKLVIRLESDLCVADGDGYSSSIDVDVCCNANGVPIIPARRIKGCLRDAAVLLGFERSTAADELFGTSGSSSGGSLRISDAVLCNSEEMINSALDEADRANPQAVLSLFTNVRAQTAIGEDGSADENTLRFIRVVNQYATPYAMPAGQDYSPLHFAATVSCGDDADQRELLELCTKALRNLGYGRNRGLGAVSCWLEDVDELRGQANSVFEGGLQGATRIAYTVKLDSTLMLPQESGTKTLDYIPGSSVLGFLANRLKNADGFDDIFLRGKLRFSPLYPVRNDVRCCPAPPFAVRVKGGVRDGRVCTHLEVRDDEVVKPLKSGFIDSALEPVSSETEVVYHHGPYSEEGLYTQQCLKAGQEFSGFIEGDPSLLEEVVGELLNCFPGEISFGRSKTAQYSRCSLAGLERSVPRGSIAVSEGRRYGFVLDSDAVLVREGSNAASFDDFEKAIKDALGHRGAFFDCADVETDAEKLGSSLRYRVVTGYNAKWNHKKPHVRAIAAGSSIVFTAAKSIDDLPGEFYVGERQAEGFGRVLVVELDNLDDTGFPLDSAPKWARPIANDSAVSTVGVDCEFLRCKTVDYAASRKSEFGREPFSHALIGRLARMVEESVDAADLDARFASIKADQKRVKSQAIACDLRNQLGEGISWDREKDCFSLLLTLAKYYAKQNDAASKIGGAR